MRAQAAAGLAALSLLIAPPVWAASQQEKIDTLLDALQVRESVAIMLEEGQTYGADIATAMLPEGPSDAWRATVMEVYDGDKMYEIVATHFAEELQGTDLDPLLDYYATEAAQTIVSLEVSARRAFLDPETEALAQERFAMLEEEGAPLLKQIEAIISDSNLVEQNVAGALNSDMMFYRGLIDGGAFEMSEADMLANVWAQEEAFREHSQTWLFPYMALAYHPVDEAALDAYIAMWRSAEGRALNRAIFAGYDEMFDDVNYLLGLAVARALTSEQL